MDECLECGILSQGPAPVRLEHKVTEQFRNWGGQTEKETEFITLHREPLIPHHNIVLVFRVFAQPDVSHRISRAHPLVIGF